jgi:hypothetical protein
MVSTKGLEVGQTIVLDGQSRLQEGTLVATTAPPPAGAAAATSQPGG